MTVQAVRMISVVRILPHPPHLLAGPLRQKTALALYVRTDILYGTMRAACYP